MIEWSDAVVWVRFQNKITIRKVWILGTSFDLSNHSLCRHIFFISWRTVIAIRSELCTAGLAAFCYGFDIFFLHGTSRGNGCMDTMLIHWSTSSLIHIQTLGHAWVVIFLQWYSRNNSVETNMVDPQWNILYWKSKRIFHGLLRCGWLWVGDNLCLLWDYLCLLNPSRRLYFTFVPPPPPSRRLYFTFVPPPPPPCQRYVLFYRKQPNGNLNVNLNELFMQTCWWPLGDHWSVHLTSIHLPGCVWYGGLESHWSYLRYVADDANGKQIITADKTLYETLWWNWYFSFHIHWCDLIKTNIRWWYYVGQC